MKLVKGDAEPFLRTFEEWKADAEANFGEGNVYYRETGAYGWSKLVVLDDGPALVPSNGPHYVDAVPRDRRLRGWLIGTYDHKAGKGQIFFRISS